LMAYRRRPAASPSISSKPITAPRESDRQCSPGGCEAGDVDGPVRDGMERIITPGASEDSQARVLTCGVNQSTFL
jgi:hypothetical protein